MAGVLAQTIAPAAGTLVDLCQVISAYASRYKFSDQQAGSL